MKKKLACGRVVAKEYARTDANGNPVYLVDVYLGEGRSLYGLTATGSPCNYGNWSEGDGVDVEYHETKRGYIVLDNIRKQKG